MKLVIRIALLVLGAIVSVSAASVVQSNATEWRLFKAQHGKSYESPNVEALRQAIFAANMKRIEQLREAAKSRGFTLGPNHLADLTHDERKVLNGLRLPERRHQNSPEAQKFLDDMLNDDSIEVPDSLDWRQTPGRVTGVKNQGQCGSCWAFATTGVLEGQVISRGNQLGGNQSLISLSEQNLVDCDKTNLGCDGGFLEHALEFVHREGGIDDEVSYPYEGRRSTCLFTKDKVVIINKSYAILPKGDEEVLKQAVAKFGPVSVGVDVEDNSFVWYESGVFYDKYCKSADYALDHAVLVVGYGTDPKAGDYWIIKNSWGAKWGEAGYMRLARNRGNNCGIATRAVIPTF